MQKMQRARLYSGASFSRILTILLVGLLVVTGCVPIQPDTQSSSTVPAQAAPPAVIEGADAIAGEWTGAINVADFELPFDLHVVAEGEGYSATLDIPMQGAMALPVTIVSLAPEGVEFSILEGAQQAVFSGALDGDGVMRGAFLQGGQEGTFTLSPVTASSSGSTASGVDRVFTHPSGLWSVPVPTGWTLTENGDYVTLQDPDAEATIFLMALAGDDAEAAIAEGWQIVQPGFDLEIDQSVTPPSGEGIDVTVVHTYETDDDARIVQAVVQQSGGMNYISLFDVSMLAAQRRQSQILIVDAGFKILDIERTDLSGVAPAPLSPEIVATWEAFIESALMKFEVPGAVVGVVSGGELVYAEGFGYADVEAQTPMTPETHMMIGSTGKSLTTMLMGILVDEGVMTWDTPAQELYADFAVMDPALSESITMRNLVCACTGVPRRDFEFIFNANSLSASDVIASLRTFEFFTDFGEAFQYSNQMVATGGYIAGVAAEPEIGEPFAAYDAALHEYVTEPIGMVNTTLSFDEVVAVDNYATPHSYNALGEYVSIPLTVETMLLPVAPAGGHWSTLADMSRYMVTQLSTGVAPDGERVISEKNLLMTREPQVNISAEVWYGLGWMISDYFGQPMIDHGGNTLGFTSDFGFLPEADLGVIVLTNGQGTNSFSGAVRMRLLELVFDTPGQVEQNVDFVMQQMEEQLGGLRDQVSGTIDEATVAPFVGVYSNEMLGDLAVTLVDGELLADFGEFTTRITPFMDDEGAPDNYILFDAPLAGFPLRLEMDEDGAPVVIIGEGLTEYTFVLVE